MTGRFRDAQPRERGWSGETKLRFTAPDGLQCLARLTPADKRERMAEVYRIMEQVAALGVPMCRPLEHGVWDGHAYIVQTWVDGEELEQALPRFSPAQQYALGQEAGRILALIHTLPGDAQPPWAERFGRKLDKTVRTYHDCPLKLADGDLFLRTAEQYRPLLATRPVTVQHGDFHVGNMLLGPDGRVHIIDFNRARTGDPWEEFRRIQWCVRVSPAFARGMVDGYFPCGAPEDFWRMLQLYTAATTLGSLAWAIPFGEEEVAVMREHARLAP